MNKYEYTAEQPSGLPEVMGVDTAVPEVMISHTNSSTPEDAKARKSTIDEVVSSITHNFEKHEKELLLDEFAQRHYYQTDNERLEYATMNDSGSEIESQLEEWAIFIGGLGSVKETYEAEMLDLALSGKHTLFVAPDEGTPPTYEENDYCNARAGALPDTIRNKAAAVAALLKHLEIINANIIGHSQGGAVAATLAGMHPELAKRLLLDNPVGLIGKDSTSSLLRRVADEVKIESEFTESIKSVGRQFARLFHSILWRVTEEVPGIAHTDIRPILESIKKSKARNGAGPEIILINSNNDQIFKKEAIEKGLGNDPLTQYIDRYAVRADKNAGHQKFGGREGGELLIQVIEEQPTHSIIHQILTEKMQSRNNVPEKLVGGETVPAID